ncbi:hypothetical protein KI387_032567, partial [Taxus chinensis]
VMKHLTMGDNAKDDELLQIFLGKSDLLAQFKEEETYTKQLGNAFLKRKKGKMIYMVDVEEVENWEIEHTKGTCEVLDNVDEK